MLGPPFSINFNTKSQKSMAKTSIPREEKGGGRKRGRGARAGGGQRLDSSQKERKREREWVRGYLCPLTLELKD